jgi:NAD(P)-dependent dehydrogenase (short-subunit alcohol dehydrogenase family)
VYDVGSSGDPARRQQRIAAEVRVRFPTLGLKERVAVVIGGTSGIGRTLGLTERGRELLLRTPMRRFGRLEELVGAAVFLSSEAASFVNGEVLNVDGGYLASGVNT